MFEPNSRYYNIKTAKIEVVDPDGVPHEIRYKQRRFIPPAKDADTLAEHTIMQGDRLDNITARYLGDPTQFWQVCDANNTMNPGELTAEPARTLRVQVPQAPQS